MTESTVGTLLDFLSPYTDKFAGSPCYLQADTSNPTPFWTSGTALLRKNTETQPLTVIEAWDYFHTLPTENLLTASDMEGASASPIEVSHVTLGDDGTSVVIVAHRAFT